MKGDSKTPEVNLVLRNMAEGKSCQELASIPKTIVIRQFEAKKQEQSWEGWRELGIRRETWLGMIFQASPVGLSTAEGKSWISEHGAATMEVETCFSNFIAVTDLTVLFWGDCGRTSGLWSRKAFEC